MAESWQKLKRFKLKSNIRYKGKHTFFNQSYTSLSLSSLPVPKLAKQQTGGLKAIDGSPLSPVTKLAVTKQIIELNPPESWQHGRHMTRKAFYSLTELPHFGQF